MRPCWIRAEVRRHDRCDFNSSLTPGNRRLRAFVWFSSGRSATYEGEVDLPSSAFARAGNERKRQDRTADRELPPFFKVRLDLHDLRLTARSLMSRAGVTSEHAERVLGHVIGGVEGVYDRHSYMDEKAAALDRLARLIDLIVNPPADNVVPIITKVSAQ